MEKVMSDVRKQRDQLDATAETLTDLGLPSLAQKLRDVIDELLPTEPDRTPGPAAHHHRARVVAGGGRLGRGSPAGGWCVVNLAEHIAAHELSGWPWACRCGGWSSDPEPGLPDRGTAQTIRPAHAAHVAETWQESRTVTTLEELAALPECVLVRDKFGEFFERGYTAWWSTADETGYGPEHISLPARILHNPEEDQ